MRHVLLLTDLSANSLNAALYATELYGATARYTVLNSFMLPDLAQGSQWNIGEVLKTEMDKGVLHFIDKIKKRSPSIELKMQPLVEQGFLTDLVQQLARSSDPPELIVMGTQGASGLQRVIMGSSTSDMIRMGILPVLAIPEKAVYRKPERILVAEDGGPVGELSRKTLEKIARSTKAKLIVFRMINEAVTADVGEDGSHVNDWYTDLPHMHLHASGMDVVESLAQRAEEYDVDMVVVTHRKRGALNALFHRSTATRLAMHMHIPMLVLQDEQ